MWDKKRLSRGRSRPEGGEAKLIQKGPRDEVFGEGAASPLPTSQKVPGSTISSKLGVIMFGCQHGRVPQYLIDYCLPVSDVAPRQHLRSTSRRLLVVPRHHLSTYGRKAFAVAGSTAWNSFPDNRDPNVKMDNFKRLLKTFLFSAYQCN